MFLLFTITLLLRAAKSLPEAAIIGYLPPNPEIQNYLYNCTEQSKLLFN